MDPSVTADLEAAKDPGALKAHTSVTDNEILGKVFSLNFTVLYCITKPLFTIMAIHRRQIVTQSVSKTLPFYYQEQITDKNIAFVIDELKFQK